MNVAVVYQCLVASAPQAYEGEFAHVRPETKKALDL